MLRPSWFGSPSSLASPRRARGRRPKLEEWKHLYREIFRLAKERALDTYVVHWSIFVSEAFAKAHGVARQNFYPHYYAPGDTSEIVKRYLRESVTQTLEEPVNWKWAFERQWLFYKLWGRLLYDPQTPDALFAAEFERRYGARAKPAAAYALASETQLAAGLALQLTWDFTLYGEGFLALQGDRTEYIAVDPLIRQPTLDPAYVSVSDFVKGTQAGAAFGADRITPPPCHQLERDNRAALELVQRIDTRGNASFMYEVADVRSGRTWACTWPRTRGALALATYRQAGGEANKNAAPSLSWAPVPLGRGHPHHAAPLPRHEAHPLQPQLLRRQRPTTSSTGQGAAPSRRRSGRRGRFVAPGHRVEEAPSPQVEVAADDHRAGVEAVVQLVLREDLQAGAPARARAPSRLARAGRSFPAAATGRREDVAEANPLGEERACPSRHPPRSGSSGHA